MKKSKKSPATFAARGAIVAALYVVLTYVSFVFGMASGAIQLRLSEALCILPIFMPEAIFGLFVGCILSNLIFSGLVLDVIFGSLATLIGALCAYLLRKMPEKIKWTATLPTVVANMLIVPLVLIYYGTEDAYWFLVFTVGIGELLSAGALGSLLYYAVNKKAKHLF